MFTRILIALALLICAGPRADAAKKMTQLTIEVRNHENEPVDRAAVIVKPMKGKDVKRAYELRTSQKGTAPLPPLEQGTFLIQVIAKGYQTHGEKYEVTEPERVIRIQLQPPQDQFSVHK
jgi:hypothetical protein